MVSFMESMFEKRAMQMMINPHTVQNKHILKTL